MASHSYLGKDLEAVRSRNFLNEGEIYEILIIPLRNIILFPGDTLPLRLRNRSYIQAIENIMKGTSTSFHGGLNSLHLGIVNLSETRITAGVVGTTSEIRCHRSQNQHNIVTANNINISNNGSGSNTTNYSSDGTNSNTNGSVSSSNNSNNNSNNASNSVFGSGINGSSSFRRPTDASEETGELILIAKGCHRFRILEEPKRVRGVLIGRVVILAENIPKFHRGEASSGPCPSWVYKNNSVDHLLNIADKLFQESLWLENNTGTPSDSQKNNRWNEHTLKLISENKENSNSTFSSSSYMKRKSENGNENKDENENNENEKNGNENGENGNLKSENNENKKIETIISSSEKSGLSSYSPLMATYYLASNMTIQDGEKQGLLEAENIVERLRMMVSMLKCHSTSDIACAECGGILASKNQLFTVPGASGIVGSYVNIAGYVHNTFTFHNLKSSAKVRVTGVNANTQDSWFPGYGWRIASCRCCGNHLGWLFTATKTKENHDGNDIDNRPTPPNNTPRTRHNTPPTSTSPTPPTPPSPTDQPHTPPLTPPAHPTQQPTQLPPRIRVRDISDAATFIKGIKGDYFWGIRRAALKERKITFLNEDGEVVDDGNNNDNMTGGNSENDDDNNDDHDSDDDDDDNNMDDDGNDYSDNSDDSDNTGDMTGDNNSDNTSDDGSEEEDNNDIMDHSITTQSFIW